jgi:hypothetical protein
MNAETNAAFDSIVLGGKLTRAGMASFADVPVARGRAVDSRAFLWREQRALRRREQQSRQHVTRRNRDEKEAFRPLRDCGIAHATGPPAACDAAGADQLAHCDREGDQQ